MGSLKYPEGGVEGRTGGCSKNLGRPVIRGKKPIELGNSWFSAKTIEVVRHYYSYKVKHWMEYRVKVIQPNYESVRRKHDRQTGGEKVCCQKGNNLDQKLRS